MPWLKSINLYAVVALVAIGGLIVTGIFRAGVKHERNKNAAETGEVNVVIVGDRGKDEAEIAANEKMAESVDAAVKANLKQTLILDEATAKALNSVR